MARFDFNVLRYLTVFMASVSIVAFLVCTGYVDMHSSIFSVSVEENLNVYLSIGFGNLIFVYSAIKNAARGHFRKY